LWFTTLANRLSPVAELRYIIDRAGFSFSAPALITGTALAALSVVTVLVLLGVPLMICMLVSAPISVVPFVVVVAVASNRRSKFIEQLPDALDLMISVLRSGLSVPQSIKAVAEEIPSPCGAEFAQVLHRMNLGQSLTDALVATSERYRLFELDLVRRAAAIQSEVGGSLADLFDKTNSTLRQRLRLKRQVRVLTAQSRLSGWIIAILPFVVMIGFQFLNPGYLTPLFTTNVGKVFLTLAIVLQVIGIGIITKMSRLEV
jgi:tight adherence protein B